MKEKAQLIIMSHLSDAQQLIGHQPNPVWANNHINFAKFLIMYTDGDLTQEVDPDEMWEKFLQR